MRFSPHRALKHFIQDEQGQSIVERALLLALIAIIALIFLSYLTAIINNIHPRLREE